MKEVTIDPIWVMAALFTMIGVGLGWYIVRLDAMVESLRTEIIGIRADIGKLQNADVTCTNDQTIIKQDMSNIRDTLLKVVARRFMRRGLRKAFRKRQRGED